MGFFQKEIRQSDELEFTVATKELFMPRLLQIENSIEDTMTFYRTNGMHVQTVQCNHMGGDEAIDWKLGEISCH